MIRQPAVAGQFYPSDPGALLREVESHLRGGARSLGDARPEAVIALVAPHAGYVYSGPVAGAVYAASELPRHLIILCPNHTGQGRPVAVMNRGEWRTPLGPVPVDDSLADALLEDCDVAEVDHRAHLQEHAIEVQLPFLQVRLGEFSFVPVCVGTARLDTLRRLGEGMGRTAAGRDEPVAFIISSDMSHYIPADRAREKDMMAVERILALDPEGLHRVVEERDISMCGYAPAVAGLTASIARGARRARLIAYANSGDASGDFDRVVGYAGLAIS